MHPLLSHRNYLSHNFPRQVHTRSDADESQGPVSRWLRGALKNWQRRKMVATLQSLDDRMLSDIGITRSSITGFVNQLDDRELRMTAPMPTKTAANSKDAPRRLAA